jgi:hypothetical protein
MRFCRGQLSGLVAAGLVVGLLGAAGVSGVERAATLDSVLEVLPVAPKVAIGYVSRDFGAPKVSQVDSRGCGKRERVLLASASVAPSVGRGCKLSGGVWKVNQGKKTIRGASRVDFVPLVSEKSVWTQGGFGWNNAQQRDFVKWQKKPARECAAGGGPGCGYVLQEKGTGGRGASVTDVMSQTQWKLTCNEASGIVGTLASWGLVIDPPARDRVVAAGCGSTKVNVKSLNKRNPVPIATAGNPFMAGGADSKVWSTSSVLSAPAGRVIDASLFGLHVPEPFVAPPSVPYSWLRLWDAKTGWEPLEQNRGIYYWKTLDDSVAYAEARGLKVLYVFGDTPAWAGPSAAYPPTDLAEYKRFVNDLVKRYGNRIQAYEVWNEPNMHSPISEGVADLVSMTKVLSDAVRTAGLSSLVLTPSTTMRTDTIVSSFYLEYLSKLGELGWPVDGYSVHTYPLATGGPAERNYAITQFKQMLALAKAPNKPIWDSEINYGLGGVNEIRRPITGDLAEGYISQTFIDSVRFGISYVDWYLWFPRDYSLLGIQLNPGTPGNNAAWKWAHDQLVGASLRACGQSGDAVVCGFTRGGSDFVLAYSTSGAEISAAVPAGLGQACEMNGVCSPVIGGKVTVGIKPVRVD